MIKNIKSRKAMLPMLGALHLGDPKPQSGPGRNSHKFRFTLKMDLEKNADITMKEKFGEEITELKVIFPRINRHDDEESLQFIFDANYKMYRGKKLWCKGDGETATRCEKDASGREEYINVACPCDFLGNGCKQQGDMNISPVELLKEGLYGFFRVTTKSWNAIKELNSAIRHYHDLLGEQFWKTTFILSKKKIVVKDNKSQWIMTLHADPKSLKKYGLFDRICGDEDLSDIFDENMPPEFEDPEEEIQEEEVPQAPEPEVENEPELPPSESEPEPAPAPAPAKAATPAPQPEPTPAPQSKQEPSPAPEKKPGGAKPLEGKSTSVSTAGPQPTVSSVTPTLTPEDELEKKREEMQQRELGGTEPQRIVRRNKILKLLKKALEGLEGQEPLSYLEHVTGLKVEPPESGKKWESCLINQDTFTLEELDNALGMLEQVSSLAS